MLGTFFNKVQTAHEFMVPIPLFKPGLNCIASIQHAQEYEIKVMNNEKKEIV